MDCFITHNRTVPIDSEKQSNKFLATSVTKKLDHYSIGRQGFHPVIAFPMVRDYLPGISIKILYALAVVFAGFLKNFFSSNSLFKCIVRSGSDYFNAIPININCIFFRYSYYIAFFNENSFIAFVNLLCLCSFSISLKLDFLLV